MHAGAVGEVLDTSDATEITFCSIRHHRRTLQRLRQPLTSRARTRTIER
jgi:hypothetical protein